jgi:hypothetical protein
VWGRAPLRHHALTVEPLVRSLSLVRSKERFQLALASTLDMEGKADNATFNQVSWRWRRRGARPWWQAGCWGGAGCRACVVTDLSVLALLRALQSGEPTLLDKFDYGESDLAARRRGLVPTMLT